MGTYATNPKVIGIYRKWEPKPSLVESWSIKNTIWRGQVGTWQFVAYNVACVAHAMIRASYSNVFATRTKKKRIMCYDWCYIHIAMHSLCTPKYNRTCQHIKLVAHRMWYASHRNRDTHLPTLINRFKKSESSDFATVGQYVIGWLNKWLIWKMSRCAYMMKWCRCAYLSS